MEVIERRGRENGRFSFGKFRANYVGSTLEPTVLIRFFINFLFVLTKYRCYINLFRNFTGKLMKKGSAG